MSGIVLVVEPTDGNNIRALGVFLGGIVNGYSTCPIKTYKPAKQAFWSIRYLHEITWKNRKLDYSELPNLVLSDVIGDYFANGTLKCQSFGYLRHKRVENLGYHDCPKLQDYE